MYAGQRLKSLPQNTYRVQDYRLQLAPSSYDKLYFFLCLLQQVGVPAYLARKIIVYGDDLIIYKQAGFCCRRVIYDILYEDTVVNIIHGKAGVSIVKLIV